MRYWLTRDVGRPISRCELWDDRADLIQGEGFGEGLWVCRAYAAYTIDPRAFGIELEPGTKALVEITVAVVEETATDLPTSDELLAAIPPGGFGREEETA